MIQGELAVNVKVLRPGDGAAISGEEQLNLAAARDAHFLFFDLK